MDDFVSVSVLAVLLYMTESGNLNYYDTTKIATRARRHLGLPKSLGRLDVKQILDAYEERGWADSVEFLVNHQQYEIDPTIRCQWSAKYRVTEIERVRDYISENVSAYVHRLRDSTMKTS